MSKNHISFDDNLRNTSLICLGQLGFKVDLFQNRPQIPTLSGVVMAVVVCISGVPPLMRFSLPRIPLP